MRRIGTNTTVYAIPNPEDIAMKTRNRLSSTLLLTFGLTISALASADEVSVATNTGAVDVPIGAVDAEFIT